MSRGVFFSVLILFATSVCVAQNAAAGQPSAAGNGDMSNKTIVQGRDSPARQPAPGQSAAETSAEKPSYALIPTLLAKPLDSKKAKAGDEVVATTSVGMKGNGMIIAKGAKVIGHLTEARARSKGDAQSSLGIVFDKVQLADGRWLAVQGVIMAIAPNPYPEVTTGSAGGFAIAQPSMGTGAGNSAGPAPTVGSPEDMNPNLERRKLVNPQSTGVIDMKNISLEKNSVLTTDAKNLKLEPGTQLVIRATVQAPAN